MKTFMPKKQDIEHKWFQIDATGKVLGRLSTKVAMMLSGKNKPDYVPFLDMGDFVVITNVEKIKVTGNKEEKKEYTSYSGYPGGLKTVKYKDLQKKDPTAIIRHAVRGMLPKNKLRKLMMNRLKLFVGDSHIHIAQKPEKIEV
ncbi:MAG: 50S ribosomal protein L13 [Candidatus Cloacimonadota bacterium]|nr:50S ribosomal protein L13 [Candidatus Cloacimonadota bacterium]